MTEASVIPTKDGDVVISYRASKPILFLVWQVIADGQKAPSKLVGSKTFPTLREAITHAEPFTAVGNGVIHLLDEDSGSWQKLAT
jgi:hypothetical protein